jgi:signal transduction histidine kinase
VSTAPASWLPDDAAAPALQRAITERLLLSALQEVDNADRAHAALIHSEYLAQTGLLVGVSLNSSTTRDAVARVSLPILGSWCIVDLIESDGSLWRLPMIHPDPYKQAVLRTLGLDWTPGVGDAYGVPAIRADRVPVLIEGIDVLLQASSSPSHQRLLSEMDIGTLLTIPMVNGDRLVGAVTFVSDTSAEPYTSEEIQLAQNIANRNAAALENARIYTEALLMREQAELATLNTLRFLGNISHDLRSPLNATMGYVELITEAIHGPVTPAQHDDLERIRSNQAHMLDLVNDLLMFVQAGTPRLNQIIRIPADEAVMHAATLLQNTLNRKSLRYAHSASQPNLMVLGDRERISQILVNLIANAVNYTMRGGLIMTRIEASGEDVRISVEDTGIGIEAGKLEEIFAPFVRVANAMNAEGAGLGLAISRDLARGMHGDVTVASAIGEGSCFTLTLPRAPEDGVAE